MNRKINILHVQKKKSDTPVAQITIVQLKRLLVLISDSVPTVCFRYRLLGQMWQEYFLRVVKVTDQGVFLKDDKTGKIICVADLHMIVQFELDGSLHAFEPNFHYDVVPDQCV